MVLGARCNLGCEDCAKLRFARSAPPDAVAHGNVIVITGGEPMLEPGLLARIRALGGRVWLESNATLLHSRANVARLSSVGLAGVRMFLPGWDAASTDRIARVDGAAALQQQAARNILSSSLGLAFVVPVRRGDAAHLVDWLGRAELLAESRRDRSTPLQVYLTWELAPEERAGAALELALGRLALTAVRRSIVVRFDGPLAPAPCAFERPEAFASLLDGSAPDRHKPDPCDACALGATCAGPAPGAPAASIARGDRDPVAFEAALATLRDARDVQTWITAGPDRRWGRENFVSIGSEPDVATGAVVHSALLRAFFHCNQDCTFCWVDLQQPRVPDAVVSQALALMALEGMTALSITGGEPTLDKRLELQVRLARALGISQVTLQTNAVRLDVAERAQGLARAGLTRAFVSLHGPDANTGEAITRAPGTFERTLRGIENLLAAGVSVGVGVVFTHENRDDARRLVELVGTRLRGVDLTLSVASPVNDRLDVRAITPRYTELAPTLREAARTAQALGLHYVGLLGQCGLPPCILDADPVCFPELAREHPEWSAAADFMHIQACNDCSLRRKCPGVRTSYATAYGTDELHAV